MIYKFPPLSTDAFSYIFGRRKRIFSGKKLAAGFTAQQLANIDGNNLFTICNKFLTIVYDSNFIKLPSPIPSSTTNFLSFGISSRKSLDIYINK